MVTNAINLGILQYENHRYYQVIAEKDGSKRKEELLIVPLASITGEKGSWQYFLDNIDPQILTALEGLVKHEQAQLVKA